MTTFSIINKLGGVTATKRALESVGYTITTAAIYHWSARKKIASMPMRLLMQIADKRGIKYTHEDFTLFLDKKEGR